MVQGYIIIYGRKKRKRNEAKSRAAAMKAQLTGFRGISSNQITTIDGGFREEFSGEFWIGERGKSAPNPTPTLKAKDVKLKGIAKIVNKPRCTF